MAMIQAHIINEFYERKSMCKHDRADQEHVKRSIVFDPCRVQIWLDAP